MVPDRLVHDLMHRTMYNLRFIDRKCKMDGPFEVTQLVNSFLGAMAHPWEKYKTELNRLTIEDAISHGWPELRKAKQSDRSPDDFGDLLRLVRNSIAHGNIQFRGNRAGEIELIRFWNINPRSKERTWGTIASIKTMRLFLQKFVNLADDVSTADVKAAHRTI